MRSSFNQFLFLTSSIGLTGYAALKLAVPPVYASPLWPPAGIALAAILLWGNRVWPGVWFGSFLINFGHGYGLTDYPTPNIFYTAMSIAAGSTLQALTGASLSRRWVAPGVPKLDDGKTIFRYVMLGGPLACLVASSLGVASLFVFGIEDDVNLFSSWWNWWIGDCLGAILISPLMFCLFAQPRALWQKRLAPLVLPLSAFFVGLIVLFVLVLKAENDRLQLEFDNKANAINKALVQSFANPLNVATSLHSFIQATGEIDRDKFSKFATHILAQNKTIHALSWEPSVTDGQRHQYEQSMRNARFENLTITELGSRGEIVKAGVRPEYFPVSYIEPQATNRQALGFDLNSEPIRREALLEARESRGLAVTKPIHLIQDGKHHPAVLLIMPLFSDKPGATENTLAGFTSVVVRIDLLVATAINSLPFDGLNLAIAYRDADQTSAPLYGSYNRTQRGITELRQSFGFANRVIEIVVQADADFVKRHASWLPWMVLLGGLLFAMLLSIYLLSATGRAALVAALVEQRTGELDNANTRLQNAFLSLAEKSQKLQDLYELSPLGIVLLNKSGKFVEYNLAFKKMIGYSAEELRVLGYRNLVPDKALDLDQHLNSLAKAGHYGTHETSFIHKKGHLISVKLCGANVHGADGEDYVWLIAENISQAKANKEILRQSELKYRNLFRGSRDAVLMADRNGFLDCNQAALDLFGFDTVSAFCQLHPGTLSPTLQADGSDSATLEKEHMDQATAKGHVEFEWLHRRADGSVFPAEVSVSRVNLDGKLVFQVVVRDLSERKRVEQALIEAKEAAEVMAEFKSEFLANMSHEIRTPMNAVIGLSQLALTKPLSAEVSGYLQQILSSAETLLNILNDILDLSKIEAGKLGVEHTEFNLPQVVAALRTLFTIQAEQKHLNIEFDIDPAVPPVVVGDAFRLQQVLSNLLSNALKFTERGGVGLSIAMVEKHETEVRIRFTVWDTGIGIATEARSKLFAPFHQLDASITRRFGGTGLGLAISQKLLRLMDSDFDVQSEVGRGARFSFELLLGIAAERTDQRFESPNLKWSPTDLTQKLRERSAPLRGTRILVAEDHAINRKVISGFLKLCGINVELANNGREALNMLNQNHYDAVLMDVQMPEMSGLAATEQLRGNPNFEHLPIIALSAGVTTNEREKCFASGMNDFIAKPINPLELVQILCTWLPANSEATAEPGPTPTEAQPQTEPPAELPVFDFENVLTMLQGDKAMLRELLDSFRQSSAAAMSAIELGLHNSDLEAARKALHGLKGTAGNLGATDLHQAAERLYSALKQGNPDHQAYAEFKSACVRTQAALNHLTETTPT